MAGLASDDYPRSTEGDDAAELLEDVGDADQVDGNDRLWGGLGRGQTRRMDDVDHGADTGRSSGQSADRLVRGDVHSFRPRLEAGGVQTVLGGHGDVPVQSRAIRP
jgi:hypothetical protein